MTISNTTRTAGPFTGTGVSTPYPFAFKVFLTTDLLVLQTDTSLNQTTLAIGTNYTVTLNSDQDAAPGGTVNLLSALPSGYTLSLTSNVSLTQPASLTNAGGFFPKTIEGALDRLTILLQQLGLLGFVQSLRVPEVGGITTIPSISGRANNLLGFDSSGNPIAVAPASGSAASLASDIANSTVVSKGAGQAGFGAGLLYAAGTVGAALRSLFQSQKDQISVKDFGALGDGTGATPASQGISIMGQSWNTWTGTPFQTNVANSPYGTGGTFAPPTAQPFQDTDTWDYIGFQRAVNTGAGIVRVPAGRYLINMNNARGSVGSGVLFMTGQETSFIGEGKYHSTVTTAENATFFANNNATTKNYYALFNAYRITSAPSNINDIGFVGPTGYPQTSTNLCGIRCANVNGLTITNCWLSALSDATSWTNQSSDNHMQGCTTEYCFGASIRQADTSQCRSVGNNFWASASVAGQYGIVSANAVDCTGTNFIGFWGGAVTAATGKFVGNTVSASGGDGPYVTINSNATIVGNTIVGSPNQQMVQVVRDSLVTGNFFSCSSPHACLNIGDGVTAGSATNLTITGNQFIQSSGDTGAQNYAITATQASVGYTQAAATAVIIAANSFQGRTQLPLGLASVRDNTVNGAMQANTYGSAAVFAGGITVSGNTSLTGVISTPGLGNYANDAAAATGGIAIGQEYRNGSIKMVRVA